MSVIAIRESQSRASPFRDAQSSNLLGCRWLNGKHSPGIAHSVQHNSSSSDHLHFGWFQFHGSNSAIRLCGICAMRASIVGQPCLWINVIELGRHDQRGHCRYSVGAAFGAGEQPRLDGRALFLAYAQTLFGAQALDVAFDVEQHVDAIDRS